jgi:hypothetical protein
LAEGDELYDLFSDAALAVKVAAGPIVFMLCPPCLAMRERVLAVLNSAARACGRLTHVVPVSGQPTMNLVRQNLSRGPLHRQQLRGRRIAIPFAATNMGDIRHRSGSGWIEPDRRLRDAADPLRTPSGATRTARVTVFRRGLREGPEGVGLSSVGHCNWVASPYFKECS